MEVDESSPEEKMLQLPDSFVTFLIQNGLDPAIYKQSDSTPRYIRIKPGLEHHVPEIEAEINCTLERLSWLPNFYFLPPDIRIASSKAYQDGKIYGIDAASGAAVSALGISSGDHVLDLCAAPGAKLCFILDLLGSSGSVTGVDIAKHRLAACRTMLLKYKLGEHCRLFVADGTTFSLPPVRVKQGESTLEGNSEVYKEWNSRRPWKERKRALKAKETVGPQLFSRTEDPELIFYGSETGVIGLSKDAMYRKMTDDGIFEGGYDKVLVDAECTHDGSIRHIQKFEQWGWETLQRRVLDAERTDEITVLQLQLLTNGFRLLKANGSLVYSTCSLTVAQNEDVVEKFLSQNTSAELVEIGPAKDWPCRSGRIPKTLRFDPSTSCTSGLFVAKFTKLAM
ncbi:OLC1v1011059C1 [Oldenlandia corymbosa var. corymbosa]|uniref:OLC1v1011059C1 n=1 Tax=Oldenlandia corymbosa var. corymbosa TaxID=529605 RepID=A0AAV1DSZ6_OLDCO|nr:OLC1v1011059C1 [Oldenlandia corymbosa var. corymbosa]